MIGIRRGRGAVQMLLPEFSVEEELQFLLKEGKGDVRCKQVNGFQIVQFRNKSFEYSPWGTPFSLLIGNPMIHICARVYWRNVNGKSAWRTERTGREEGR